MKKTYWGWYKYIENDTNDKTIEIELEIEIEIRSWNM